MNSIANYPERIDAGKRFLLEERIWNPENEIDITQNLGEVKYVIQFPGWALSLPSEPYPFIVFSSLLIKDSTAATLPGNYYCVDFDKDRPYVPRMSIYNEKMDLFMPSDYIFLRADERFYRKIQSLDEFAVKYVPADKIVPRVLSR